MTFFYSDNQFPRKANAKMNLVTFLSLKNKAEEITIHLQSHVKISL